MKRRDQNNLSGIGRDKRPYKNKIEPSRLKISFGSVLAGLGIMTLVGDVHGQAVDLGTAEDFAIISYSGVTSTGLSNVYGDIALYNTATITGFINTAPPSGVGYVHGDVYYNDGVAGTAWTDAGIANVDLAGRSLGSVDMTGLDLGSRTLVAGLYHFDTSAGLTGQLILDTGSDANAQFIFQIGSTLETAVGSSITLIGAGAGLTQNIFWQVGSSATLYTGSTFVGNILAGASISLQEGSSVELGRLFALGGAVTLINNSSSPQGIVLAGPGSYWNGRYGNEWTTGGDNWSSTEAGVDEGELAINADVIFSVTSAHMNQDTVLVEDVTISSLTVNDVIPVTIGGDYTLSISATGGNTGITINDGAGLTTINSNLNMGSLYQVVSVNNDDGLLINGVISGTNGLNKTGEGVLTLTAAEVYTGATYVFEGTLQLGDGAIAGSSISLLSSILVDENGVFAINLADGETFLNNITDNGQIQWIANGTNTQDVASVFSGTGSMLVTAPGTTVLLGSNTFTGGTTIGTTDIFDTTGDVSVGNPLAFGTGVLTINNGSIDTVASQPLQIEVGGYEQTGGELRIRLSGPGGAVNTLYNVTGTADINGGTVFLYDDAIIGGYIPSEGDSQTIIQSTGLRTGTGFDDNTPDSLIQGIAYSQGNTLLYPTLRYDDPNSVFVLWIQDAFAALIDLTPNQTAVANSIDAGDAPSDVVDYLNTQDISLLPGLYDLIAPDELTAIYQMGFTGAEIQNANIKRHLERVRQGSSRQTQYTQTTTDSKGGMAQQESMMMGDTKRWIAFFEGTDGSASIDGDYNSSGYDFDSRGANLGADYRVSDRLSIGIMGSYADSDASLVNGGSIEAESFKGAVYATYYEEAFYVDGLLGMGYHSYDTRRVGLLGLAEGSTNAWEIDAMLNTGYDIKRGNWTYGPTASVAYTRMMLDGFTETGSLAPLRFPSQHQDSLRTELGGKIAYNADFNGMRVTPQVRLAWQHEFMDSKQAMESSFVGGTGSTFIVHGPDMDRDRAVLSAGVTVQVTPTVSVYGFYDGHVGSTDYKSNQVTAGVKIDF